MTKYNIELNLLENSLSLHEKSEMCQSNDKLLDLERGFLIAGLDHVFPTGRFTEKCLERVFDRSCLLRLSLRLLQQPCW